MQNVFDTNINAIGVYKQSKTTVDACKILKMLKNKQEEKQIANTKHTFIFQCSSCSISLRLNFHCLD